MISSKHPNRGMHNWVLYDSLDKLLLENTRFYRGAIYDLGCGESPYREFFLQYGTAYVGVDWAGTLHDCQPDIEADLNKPLPIEHEVADTVISVSALEHLSEPEMMLGEAFRILKPGGCLIVQVPWQWWIHEAPFDFYRYTPYGLKYLLEKVGFVCDSISPQTGLFTTLILKLNYFTLRFAQGRRLVRWPLKLLLTPIWYVGQLIAPVMDKMDKDWTAESAGFFVRATKPSRYEPS